MTHLETRSTKGTKSRGTGEGGMLKVSLRRFTRRRLTKLSKVGDDFNRRTLVAYKVDLSTIGVSIRNGFSCHAGKHITRDGSEENPALFIKREGRGSGNPVLKKASEVHVLGDEDISTSQKVETQRQHEKEGL